MKVLFYNPFEHPNKVRIVSSVFSIDVCYEAPYDGVKLNTSFDTLFNIAKCQVFDNVEVYLTPQNEAYTRKNKKDLERVPVIGWVSLKEVRDGGGYNEDILRHYSSSRAD